MALVQTLLPPCHPLPSEHWVCGRVQLFSWGPLDPQVVQRLTTSCRPLVGARVLTGMVIGALYAAPPKNASNC